MLEEHTVHKLLYGKLLRKKNFSFENIFPVQCMYVGTLVCVIKHSANFQFSYRKNIKIIIAAQ